MSDPGPRQRTNKPGLIRRLLPYYRPYRFLLTTDLLAVVLLAGMNILLPYLVKVFIDTVVPARSMELLIKIAAGIGAVVILKFAFTYYTLYAGHIMAVKMERDMRKDLFYHLQKLSFTFYDDRKTGEIMSRMINDIGRVSDSVNHAPEDISLSVLSIAGTFAVMAFLHWKLALICFLPIPFMALYSQVFGKRLFKGFRAINDSTADINARVENSLSGIRVVKSFAREDYEKAAFDTLNEQYFRNWRGAILNLAKFFGGISALRDFSYLIIIVAGGLFIFRGSLTLGGFTAFLFYVGIYLEPIERLARTNEMIQKMTAGLSRFFEILDIEPEIRDAPDPVRLENPAGRIEFRDVAFQYTERKDIFRGLDLTIEPGRTVALVGPSGAGKTTFCSLIPRFYDISEGTITIDGIDIRNITLKSLREHIGIVQQDVFLFSGTIRENIVYGRMEADEEAVVRAAQRANAHDFITELPAGYDTNIGEKGVKLSGGQKQRISIARVFLKDPRILILDEATSSLDTESEMVIQEALSHLVKGRTSFVIAHRLSTIKHADRIIVLSEHGIEQRGTHEELLRRPGLYARLYTAHRRDKFITDEDVAEMEGL
ncbi:MAG: ABC transporter ATP-binding protein [Spirochaetota bacterium]